MKLLTVSIVGLFIVLGAVHASAAQSQKAKVKGTLEVSRLREILLGKRPEYVLKFLGYPTQRVTSESGRVFVWHYEMYDSHNRPARDYVVHDHDRCKFCRHLAVFFNAGTLTVHHVMGSSDSNSAKSPARQISAEEFEHRMMLAGITPLGVSIFRKVEIRGDELYLWLRDPSFAGPNLYNYPQFADAFGKWCDCDGVTYVGIDLSQFGAGEAIMFTLHYDRAAGRSTMSSGNASTRD